MANFDESEMIHSSDFQVDPDQATLKFLRGGYSRLVDTTADLSDRVGSVESTMEAIQRTLLQISTQLGKRPIEAEPSHLRPPVTHSDPYIRDDVNRLPLDNRKSLLRKIEMPNFDGYNTSDWLSKVERFFSVRRYSDLDKLDLVALSLEGDVLIWFDREMTRCEFHSWEEFRRRLFLRFGAAPEDAPGNRRLTIKQKETVSAYVTEFEELSAHVIGLEDSHLEQIFNEGLKTEMQEVLKLKEPVGWENQKKSRCLKASMFNFKRKKKRIKRRHNQLKYNYASVREDWFNTLSRRESWRKHKHDNLQIVSELLGFTLVYFRCHKEYSLVRMINWRNMPSIAVIAAKFKFKRGLETRILIQGYLSSTEASIRNDFTSDGIRLRVHQQQQKRKFTKSWSFKYKSRLKKIQLTDTKFLWEKVHMVSCLSLGAQFHSLEVVMVVLTIHPSLRNTRFKSREMQQFVGFMKFQLKHKWRSKHSYTQFPLGNST